MANTLNLFLFAHQDDEFGVFWKIHYLASRGEKVIVVYLTSGDFEGKPNDVRDNESTKVLKNLGVETPHIYFLGRELSIPDGGLVEHLDATYQHLLSLIKTIGVPTHLYSLAWEGGHQDHDAVYLMSTLLAKQFNIVNQSYQFPLYTGNRLPSIFFKLFSPLKENGIVYHEKIPLSLRLKFITYFFYYRSQKKAWLGLFPFFLFHHIFFGDQVLQKICSHRIFESPHSGKLLYERRGFYKQDQFKQLAMTFINSISKEL